MTTQNFNQLIDSRTPIIFEQDLASRIEKATSTFILSGESFYLLEEAGKISIFNAAKTLCWSSKARKKEKNSKVEVLALENLVLIAFVTQKEDINVCLVRKKSNGSLDGQEVSLQVTFDGEMTDWGSAIELSGTDERCRLLTFNGKVAKVYNVHWAQKQGTCLLKIEALKEIRLPKWQQNRLEIHSTSCSLLLFPDDCGFICILNHYTEIETKIVGFYQKDNRISSQLCIISGVIEGVIEGNSHAGKVKLFKFKRANDGFVLSCVTQNTGRGAFVGEYFYNEIGFSFTHRFEMNVERSVAFVGDVAQSRNGSSSIESFISDFCPHSGIVMCFRADEKDNKASDFVRVIYLTDSASPDFACVVRTTYDSHLFRDLVIAPQFTQGNSGISYLRKCSNSKNIAGATTAFENVLLDNPIHKVELMPKANSQDNDFEYVRTNDLTLQEGDIIDVEVVQYGEHSDNTKRLSKAYFGLSA